jgi:hypothetical protein
MRPYLLHVDVDKVRKTFQRTTQFATNVMFGHRIIQTIQSPFLPTTSGVATNLLPTLSSPKLLLLHQWQMMAQILLVVLHLSLIFTECHLKNSSSTLLKMSFKRGAMDKLITDSARVEISKRVGEILRALCIDDWQSEPITNIRTAEHRWKVFKRNIQWYMNGATSRKHLVTYR